MAYIEHPVKRLVPILFALLVSTFSCCTLIKEVSDSAGNSTNTNTSEPGSSEQAALLGKIDCDGSYEVERVETPDYNLIRIVVGESVIEEIKLPTGVDINGFSLREVKRSRRGFSFSIDYGSRYYFKKDFKFNCTQGQFFLTRITVISHDQSDPANSGKEVTKPVTPPAPLRSFTIDKYIRE
jgi:hypothetical protein